MAQHGSAAQQAAAEPPAYLIADGSAQPYRAAEGVSDFDEQLLLAKTVKVAMEGNREVRLLVQNNGTEPLTGGTIAVAACKSGAYTGGMATLRPLAPGGVDVVTILLKPTHKFGFGDAPSTMVVSLRRDGGAPREYVFREHVSEHANELRTKHLKTRNVRVLLLGAPDSGKSSLRNTAHTALARRGRSGVSSVAAVGGNTKAGSAEAGSEKQSHTVAVEYTLVDRVLLIDGPGTMVTHQHTGPANGPARPTLVSLLMEGSAVPGMTMDDLIRLSIQEKERTRLRSEECGGPNRVPQSVIFCVRADEVAGEADPATQARARAAYDTVRDHRALVAVTFSDLKGITAEKLQEHGEIDTAALARSAAKTLGVDAQLVHVLINYTAETEPQHGMDVAVLRLLRASVAQADEWEQQRVRREEAKVDTLDDLLGADD